VPRQIAANLLHLVVLPVGQAVGDGHDDNSATRAILPPVIGFGAPVVVGKLIGNPRNDRAARKAKHSASMASPRQPIVSADTASTSARSSSAFIIGITAAATANNQF
jgi:hypothetical protein